jgi:hypothetical protein
VLHPFDVDEKRQRQHPEGKPGEQLSGHDLGDTACPQKTQIAAHKGTILALARAGLVSAQGVQKPGQLMHNCG